MTTADFGAAEFLANDWRLRDLNMEPAEVDVTDWVFSGSGGTAFAVMGNGATATDPTPQGDNPTTPTAPGSTGSGALPAVGEGFVYSRNGQPILVPAELLTIGAPWKP